MKKNIVRFSTADFEIIAKHLANAGEDESFVYILQSQAKNTNNMIYICRQVLIPDKNELTNQSYVSIEPDQRYQATAYGLAYDQKLSISDVHTHPFSCNARFSPIDDHHGIQNARYISSRFPETTEMGMIVFGRGFDNFEARIWNRKTNTFDPVNRIEILGAPTTILKNSKKTAKITGNDPYARHRIIPGWEQGLLEDLKVFVCGLGGNGALVFDNMLSLGVGGNEGWIKACDPDVLEDSNLPRIPYTYPEEVGYSKAEIAQIHADNRTPHLNVQCYENGVEDEKVQSLIKEANIIIGAIDNDGARRVLNELAVRYMIPYIDLATEIIPDGSEYESVGQIHIYIPGRTGCLLCAGNIDPSNVSLDAMSEEDKAQYEQAGYVRGTNETPTPSVLHLNGIVSHFSVSQFIKMLFDDGIKGKECLLYNSKDQKVIPASVEQKENCPACGVHGYLGSGDEDKKSVSESLKNMKNVKVSKEVLKTEK